MTNKIEESKGTYEKFLACMQSSLLDCALIS